MVAEAFVADLAEEKGRLTGIQGLVIKVFHTLITVEEIITLNLVNIKLASANGLPASACVDKKRSVYYVYNGFHDNDLKKKVFNYFIFFLFSASHH